MRRRQLRPVGCRSARQTCQHTIADRCFLARLWRTENGLTTVTPHAPFDIRRKSRHRLQLAWYPEQNYVCHAKPCSLPFDLRVVVAESLATARLGNKHHTVVATFLEQLQTLGPPGFYFGTTSASDQPEKSRYETSPAEFP